MLKNKLKSKKGITLIALIVTIVVLLILAGVSISLILGNNGIIGKAKEAARLLEEETAKDEMGMYLAGLKIRKNTDDPDFRLADYLSTNIGSEGIEDYLNNGDGYAQVVYKGYKFLVNLDDYSFTLEGKANGGVTRRIKQVLGNNNNDVPGIAMVEAGEIETEDLGWEVLSVNPDGTVNLIAKNNTGFEVSISGINGYTNGVKALNEICSKLYGNLEINGKKVISARSVNAEDFYNIKYNPTRTYNTAAKVQPYVAKLDTQNYEFSTDQITEYIDATNTSPDQSKNSNMLNAPAVGVQIVRPTRSNKEATKLMSTGNQYWIATREIETAYDSGTWQNNGGDTEEHRYEVYRLNFARTDGALATIDLYNIQYTNTSGSNGSQTCALRPVITVPADCVPSTAVGTSVTTDPFYKGKIGEEAHGYVKADSIASLLGVNLASVNKINSGLPMIELDMTWTKMEDGGYDLLTGEFDTTKYDYYIADRTTKLQVRLTGAEAYNNGVLAMDNVCNNIYGNLTTIKLSNGSTKKVEVALARNAKFEDFYIDPEANTSYGQVWSTNASKASGTDKVITATNNRYAPTLFAYEDIDPSNGISNGYSDAKIKSYNLSTSGIKETLSEEQRSSYSYEYYNPDLTVIYNALWGTRPTRNKTVESNTGADYWLSSRCVNADWYGSRFRFRYMSGGSVTASNVFGSNAGVGSYCRGLRPVLQVSK